MGTKMPDIPDNLLAKIVKLVTDDRRWLLGPILKAGRRGRDLMYKDDVLKDACIYTFCTDPNDLYSFHSQRTGLLMQGRYRPIFERCLKAGYKTVIYYEGLRVVAEGRDIKGSIELLAQLVREDGFATLACGVFSICDGNEGMVVHYLEEFGKVHAALGTEEIRRWGEELVRELRPYRRMSNNSYQKTFLYPIAIPSRRWTVPWTAS
ncbi:hypothetical protein ISN45_Aa06g027770 [Arabidopsis thaliana x Arabidopsis arenosa]|uniref:Uncharacterized protein n=1 Tax=Arabidopsis thaliana x Arabidopsis arenosa TaxID=1240361 RepID=A0A8T1Z1K4_9BRAS|nr:hypothetical protein ISN45_Aa06g027770 [Arabidopsis thaliana x Arabidopsis arenosa]